jgi:hypothetical protein
VKRSTIRGVRIVREPYVPPNRVPENLRYEIDVYDDRDRGRRRADGVPEQLFG